MPYVRVARRLRTPQGQPELDPLERTAGLDRTFSQVRKRFELRHLPGLQWSMKIDPDQGKRCNSAQRVEVRGFEPLTS